MIADNDGVCTTEIIPLSIPIGGDNRYLFYSLKHPDFLEYVTNISHGLNMPRLGTKAGQDAPIPLPPLNEQKRIADKLDTLLTRVDACRERLDRVPQILKRFRQAVLAAATAGALTEEWREKNPGCVGAKQGSSASPAFDLRGKKGEAGETFASPLQDRGAGEGLPEGWQWTTLAEVCEAVVDCPHSTPKWTHSGKLCIRTTNFKPGVLDLSELQYVTDETFDERIQRLRPNTGDIVYSREGGILGIACIIPSGVELCLGQRMMLFRTNSDCRSEFLMHCLNSPRILTRVQELTGGSASPHLNVRDIKCLPVPLPPLPEQHEIVRRVETLFAFADRLESRYTAARKQIDQLTPSLLAKAFRGELASQDQNDESAEKLLERISMSQVTCGGTETKARRRKTPDQE